jgi:membrane-bound serine protease (ClpP class)
VIHHADVPGTDLLLPIVAGLATVGGLIVVGTAWFARMSMRQPVITGEQGMIGATAEAVDSFSDKGSVRYGGELWKAHTSAPVTAGQPVRILKVEGLLLWVEPS